jgi:hypothetical protein
MISVLCEGSLCNLSAQINVNCKGLWAEVSMAGYLPHILSCWCVAGLVS